MNASCGRRMPVAVRWASQAMLRAPSHSNSSPDPAAATTAGRSARVSGEVAAAW
ncbi:hypothetical protein ACVDFE_33375 [Lentzea chajnantorensis]